MSQHPSAKSPPGQPAGSIAVCPSLRIADPAKPKPVTYRVLADSILAMKSIGPASKLVIMVLQAFGRSGAKCYPSNERLAERCGLSRATVTRALAELAQAGLIAVVEDATTPTGRRFDRLWIDDPKLHPQATDRLAAQNEPGLEAQNEPIALRLKMSPKRSILENSLETTSADPSSTSKSQSSPAEERSPDDPQVLAAVAKAVSLWPGDDPVSVRARTLALCREFGTAGAASALDLAGAKVRRTKIAIAWAWVVATARNQLLEGGPIGLSSTAPLATNRPELKPAPIAPAELPEMWLQGQPEDFLAAFRSKPAEWQADATARLLKARSPAVVGMRIYAELGLHAMALQ